MPDLVKFSITFTSLPLGPRRRRGWGGSGSLTCFSKGDKPKYFSNSIKKKKPPAEIQNNHEEKSFGLGRWLCQRAEPQGGI
ncbi:MAG: hypothetical protein U5L95_01185 [Candidatus Saccharibacteria bacterium]|nr:hypothetical protein [Candidatus Saccharibacteria bacterium]